MAERTYKRIVVRLKLILLILLLAFMIYTRILYAFFRVNHFLINWGSTIKGIPNTTQLSKWPKRCSLKLVKKVCVLICPLCKISNFWLYWKLNLAKVLIFKANVNENIIGSLPQSIFYSNYLYFIGLSFANSI